MKIDNFFFELNRHDVYKTKQRLEIAHVLVMDIVGYSKLCHAQMARLGAAFLGLRLSD